jgi:hypothetical protein
MALGDEASFCAQPETDMMSPLLARKAPPGGGGDWSQDEQLLVTFVKDSVSYEQIRTFGTDATREGIEHLIIVFVDDINPTTQRFINLGTKTPKVINEDLSSFQAFHLLEFQHNGLRIGGMPQHQRVLSSAEAERVCRRWSMANMLTIPFSDTVPRLLGCAVGQIIHTRSTDADGTRDFYSVCRLPELTK